MAHERLGEVELIESGGYGNIYRKVILDPSDPLKKKTKQIAIKQMDLDQEVPFFATLKEVNTLRVFRHPHIVTFQKVRVLNPKRKSSNLKSYKVEVEMDFWDTDLHRLVRRAYPNGMSVKESFRILSQIISGLMFLHSHEIYHLDLKPANILVNLKEKTDEVNIVSICDFGCGTYHYFDNVVNIGTVNCRPIENFVHLMNESMLKKVNDIAGVGCYYSARTDVWACGCLLTFLLTGKNLLFPEGDFTYEFPEKRIEQFLSSPEKYIQALLDPISSKFDNKTKEKERIVTLLLSLLSLKPDTRPLLETVIKNDLFNNYKDYFQIKGYLFKPLYTNINFSDDKLKSFKQIILSGLPFLTFSGCVYKTGMTALDLSLRVLVTKKDFDFLDLTACVRLAFIFFEDHEEEAYKVCAGKYTLNQVDMRCLQILDLLKGYLIIGTPFSKCSTITELDDLLESYFKVRDYFNWKPKVESKDSDSPFLKKTWGDVIKDSQVYKKEVKN